MTSHIGAVMAVRVCEPSTHSIMRPIDRESLMRSSVLTERGADHLTFLRQMHGTHRDCDPGSPVMTAREALFGAATNLECGQPQAQPGVAAMLREVAGLLVNLDAARTDLHTAASIDRLLSSDHVVRALREMMPKHEPPAHAKLVPPPGFNDSEGDEAL